MCTSKLHNFKTNDFHRISFSPSFLKRQNVGISEKKTEKRKGVRYTRFVSISYLTVAGSSDIFDFV